MNRRIKKKFRRKLKYNDLSARRNCIYCINWGFGCANGHSAVYPNDKSDFLYGGCKEEFNACNFFAKQLKKEKLSLSGWRLIEVPATYFYIFGNGKKHKEITDKDKYRYIYFGKGQVFRKQNGDYNIVFNENFDGSIKKVKCVLSEKMIEDCMFGKANKLDMLNSAIGKEKYIYVFASKNISEKYKTVYLLSLIHI